MVTIFRELSDHIYILTKPLSASFKYSMHIFLADDQEFDPWVRENSFGSPSGRVVKTEEQIKCIFDDN